jgi:hypothetical protein
MQNVGAAFRVLAQNGYRHQICDRQMCDPHFIRPWKRCAIHRKVGALSSPHKAGDAGHRACPSNQRGARHAQCVMRLERAGCLLDGGER